MNKALFFDIDGTLVSFTTHTIPQSCINALEIAHNVGNKIIISTGRPTAIITNLSQLSAKGLIDGYITMNGAFCYCGNKVLYSKAIPQKDVELIAAFCRAKAYPCIYVGEHSMTIAGTNQLATRIFEDQLAAPPIPHTQYESPLCHPVFQLTPFFSVEEQNELSAEMPDCEFGRWHPAFVDITARGVTKANGISLFLDYYGISIDDSIAFGDGGNDIPMLKFAGIGIAMGNANANVKTAADYVTSSVDDDGVANALRHFGIIS